MPGIEHSCPSWCHQSTSCELSYKFLSRPRVSLDCRSTHDVDLDFMLRSHVESNSFCRLFSSFLRNVFHIAAPDAFLAISRLPSSNCNSSSLSLPIAAERVFVIWKAVRTSLGHLGGFPRSPSMNSHVTQNYIKGPNFCTPLPDFVAVAVFFFGIVITAL